MMNRQRGSGTDTICDDLVTVLMDIDIRLEVGQPA